TEIRATAAARTSAGKADPPKTQRGWKFALTTNTWISVACSSMPPVVISTINSLVDLIGTSKFAHVGFDQRPAPTRMKVSIRSSAGFTPDTRPRRSSKDPNGGTYVRRTDG